MNAEANPTRSKADKHNDGGAKAAAPVFKPLAGSTTPSGARDLEAVMDIPVTLSVELGRTRMAIKQLLETAQGSLIQLDSVPGEPLDILVNGHLVAQGEIVVAEGKFGIRVTEIVTPAERIQRLNR